MGAERALEGVLLVMESGKTVQRGEETEEKDGDGKYYVFG